MELARLSIAAAFHARDSGPFRDKIAIQRYGHTAATVHKALVGIRARFAIDVENGTGMKAHGNVVDHEYEIERDGDTVATISKKWFRVRDCYGVEVATGEDAPLILAITVPGTPTCPSSSQWRERPTSRSTSRFGSGDTMPS